MGKLLDSRSLRPPLRQVQSCLLSQSYICLQSRFPLSHGGSLFFFTLKSVLNSNTALVILLAHANIPLFVGPNLLQRGYLKVLHNLLQEGQVHKGPGPSIQKVLGGTAAGVFKLLGLCFAKHKTLGFLLIISHLRVQLKASLPLLTITNDVGKPATTCFVQSIGYGMCLKVIVKVCY